MSIHAHRPLRRRGGRGSAGAALALIAGLFLLPACGEKEEPKEEKQPSRGYFETVLDSRGRAEAVVCQGQLKGLAAALAAHAAANGGRFPPSLEALAEKGAVPPKLLRCPSARGKPYAYVAAQNASAPGGNVLVYEEAPVHGGNCNVLYVNGSVGALTAAELKAALAETRKKLK